MALARGPIASTHSHFARHRASLQATTSKKYLSQLMKEVSTFLCYEATASLKLEACDVKTCVGDEKGQKIAERVGIVPVLRGGLGMVESMTEMVSNAQVWHLGIYRDKTSLLPIEYYNKLPKKVTVHTVFVLDPMPISGATAVAAIDILKAWGESMKPQRELAIVFVCIVASTAAIQFISEAHPQVPIHVGLVDAASIMPGMGDIADRLFGTDGAELMTDEQDGMVDE
jgi:uracil phosphoribosyltransferase